MYDEIVYESSRKKKMKIKKLIGLCMMAPQYIILAFCVAVVFVYFLANYIHTIYIVIVLIFLHTLKHYGEKIYNNNK